MQSTRADGTLVLDFNVHLTGEAAVAFLDFQERQELRPTNSKAGAELIARALGVREKPRKARRKAV